VEVNVLLEVTTPQNVLRQSDKTNKFTHCRGSTQKYSLFLCVLHYSIIWNNKTSHFVHIFNQRIKNKSYAAAEKSAVNTTCYCCHNRNVLSLYRTYQSLQFAKPIRNSNSLLTEDVPLFALIYCIDLHPPAAYWDVRINEFRLWRQFALLVRP
jgi:hypothetical protein